MHDRSDAVTARVEVVIAEAAPALLGYFLHRVEVREDAADLVSETMIAAVRAERRMPREPEAARMWLFGIARNMLRHHRRGSTRRDALVVRLADTLGASDAHDPDVALDVRAAVRALPDDLAELVRLVHWDGFTLEQAASHLGIPASTARGRHARAKRLLRERLDSRVRVV